MELTLDPSVGLKVIAAVLRGAGVLLDSRQRRMWGGHRQVCELLYAIPYGLAARYNAGAWGLVLIPVERLQHCPSIAYATQIVSAAADFQSFAVHMPHLPCFAPVIISQWTFRRGCCRPCRSFYYAGLQHTSECCRPTTATKTAAKTPHIPKPASIVDTSPCNLPMSPFKSPMLFGSNLPSDFAVRQTRLHRYHPSCV